MENIKQILEAKRASLITEIELDSKYTEDRINGQFYRGRVAVETHFKEFIESLMDKLN